VVASITSLCWCAFRYALDLGWRFGALARITSKTLQLRPGVISDRNPARQGVSADAAGVFRQEFGLTRIQRAQIVVGLPDLRPPELEGGGFRRRGCRGGDSAIELDGAN